MSIDALWTIAFEALTRGWTNGGVVVLDAGRLYGGNSQYYYLGRYTLEGARIDAEIRAIHYAGPAFTAFGGNALSYELRVEGMLFGRRISGEIYQPAAPAERLKALMVRREALS